jgi:phosphosulfolactate synthase (CoM biosynthesis protein A)
VARAIKTKKQFRTGELVNIIQEINRIIFFAADGSIQRWQQMFPVFVLFFK